MTKTYIIGVTAPNQTRNLDSWLPSLCWLPLALSINSFFIPPGTSLGYWGRWIGLAFLVIYGLCKIVLPSKWKINKFDYFAFVFFLLITISTVCANTDGALYISDFYQTGVFKAFSLLLTYLFLTLGVQSLIKSLNDAIDIIKKLVFIVTIIYTVGLIGNLSGLIPEFVGFYSGIFINPNTTAAVGVIILPLCLWVAFSQKQWGVFRLLPLLVIIAAVALSEARTPFVVISILTIYYLMSWLRYQGWSMTSIYAMSAIAISLFSLLSIYFWESDIAVKLYDSLTDTRYGGITSYRTSLIWPLFIKEIFSSPVSALIGNGWGSEEALLKSQGLDTKIFEIFNLGNAHSAYLGLTYQIGLIGLALTFLPLWAIVFNQIKESSSFHNREEFEFKLALVGALLAELCVCFFESGFYNIGSAHALPGWLVTYIAVKVPEIGK
ncbi:O-antigen ligase [Nostoc sp. PCC 7107]|uniref:O-antigen ligase family protein n=1 Tax=Nostoc sp. PCC 7107 TaxID=317936 RepID=UPI00029F0B5F|nr:O-antigen ligase family protein [Nostoc sp. PCC 7107]AFY43932.1 hypothetical protein Nos7107_3352 [Nostoc sp. PCC 7107]